MGSITGTGELAFVGGDLQSPLAFTGQVVIMSDHESVVTVDHRQALGTTGQPVVVAGGDLNLRTVVDSPLRIDAGRVRLNVPSFNGQVELRGGALVSDAQTVQVNAPIELFGGGSRLESIGSSQLIINSTVTGDGDLRIGRQVLVNGAMNVGGDLHIDGPEVEFRVAPTIGGHLVLNRSDNLFATPQATFRTDVTLPILIRGGSLVTEDGAIFSSATPTLEIQDGYVSARLGAVDTILKTGPRELRLHDTGSTNATVVVREGTVEVLQPAGLGSAGGGVVIESRQGAELTLVGLGDGEAFADSIELRGATGIDHRGGLRLSGLGGTLTGALDLGQPGAIIRAELHHDHEFTIAGEVRGGDLTLIGGGKVQLTSAEANYTGRTIVGGSVLSIARRAWRRLRLSNSSAPARWNSTSVN